MTEYIEKKTAIAFLEKHMTDVVADTNEGIVKQIYLLAKNHAEEYLQTIPAADVQEVRHGEWAINQDDLYWGNFLKRRYCSVCDKPPFYDRKKGEFVLTDYCPNCGAKMDGKVDA